MEPPNNGHVGDECFVHYSEVVPSLGVLTCVQLLAGSLSIVYREVVRSLECPLSEVPLYTYIHVCPSTGKGPFVVRDRFALFIRTRCQGCA